jgi:hypothetical protein
MGGARGFAPGWWLPAPAEETGAPAHRNPGSARKPGGARGSGAVPARKPDPANPARTLNPAIRTHPPEDPNRVAPKFLTLALRPILTYFGRP